MNLIDSLFWIYCLSLIRSLSLSLSGCLSLTGSPSVPLSDWRPLSDWHASRCSILHPLAKISLVHHASVKANSQPWDIGNDILEMISRNDISRIRRTPDAIWYAGCSLSYRMVKIKSQMSNVLIS